MEDFNQEMLKLTFKELTQEVENVVYKHYQEHHPTIISTIELMVSKGRTADQIEAAFMKYAGANKSVANHIGIIAEYLHKQKT